MRPERRRRGAAACLLATALAAGAGAASGDRLAEGRAALEAGRTREAVAALETAARLEPGRAEAHYWLGRAYGAAAEEAAWHRAPRLALATRASLARAVDLDPEMVAAVRDLMRYHVRAPALLGGDRERARELARRLVALDPGYRDDEEVRALLRDGG